MRHQSFKVRSEEMIDAAFKFIDVNDFENASKILVKYLDIQPNSGRALQGLGLVALLTGRNGLAVAMFRQALNNPEVAKHAFVWMQLGVALTNCQRNEEALKAHLKAHEMDPNEALHLSNAAAAVMNSGRYEEVIKYARKAYALNRDDANVQWNLANGYLEKGIISRHVWELHEGRRFVTSGVCKQRHYPGNPPMWDGDPTKRLVIHGEQGLGDEIMFASCVNDVLNVLHKHPIIECAPRLERLFARSFPNAMVVGTHDLEGKDLPGGVDPEAYCPLGSLPMLFRPSVESFPGTPYLRVDPDKVAAIRARLPEGKLRVGVAWQGGGQNTRIDLRSILPEQWKPILANDCDFVSLQYTKQAAADAAEMGIHHWPEAEADDMDDVAALVASCDLVISVCTTAIHIAGALGVPCWVLVPSGHAWRYGGTGETMPWYRSVRLFRQKCANWDETIGKVADGLADYRELPEAERAASRRAA